MDEDKSTMIMIIAMLIGAVVVLSGCQTYTENGVTTINPTNIPERDVSIHKNCEDKVICYMVTAPYKAAGSCFRDADLVDKYC
jgi:hypothetical protein